MWKWTWEMWHKKCGMRNVVVCGVGHNIRCKAISHENHGGDPVWRCPRKVQKIFVELCCWYLWRCNAKCIVWVTQLKFVSSVHFVLVNNVCILTACILSFCILSPCHLSLYHLSVYHLSGYLYNQSRQLYASRLPWIHSLKQSALYLLRWIIAGLSYHQENTLSVQSVTGPTATSTYLKASDATFRRAQAALPDCAQSVMIDVER